MIERLLDGVLGDLVLDVPGDGLAFAIGVGGQQQLRRILHRGLEVRDLLLLVVGNDVVRRELVLDVDAEPPPLLLLDLFRDLGGGLGQIADVAVARLDPVLVPEEASQRLRLRRRLHDH